MNDRDVEAQPGDNQQMELGDGPLEQSADEQPIVMPRKADISRSDQARRLRPWGRSGVKPAGAEHADDAPSQAPLLRTTGTMKRPSAQARPISRPQSRPIPGGAESGDAPVRVGTPHPLSRARRDADGPSGLARGFDMLRRAGSSAFEGGGQPGRPHVGRPGKRGFFGFAGLTATVAIVSALIVTLPNHPVAPAPTGSVYGITWQTAGALPVASLDFGPYFTSLDQSTLMLGTVSSASNGAVSSTTTVWSTTDASAWTQASAAGAFGIDGRRFVAQGLSDDGQGGLVAVGNSLGTSPTDVSASAWHSRDGSSWTPMVVDSGTGQEMVAGAASHAGAVVTAGNGIAWLSTDGETWSAHVLPGASTAAGSYTPRAVGSWSGGFVIIGLWNGTGPVRSAAWYSVDGRTWLQAGTSLDGFDARGIAAVDGRIVAVGSDLGDTAPSLGAAWSSPDGNIWTKTTAPSDQSNVSMDGVTSVGGTLLSYGAPPPSTTPAAASAVPTLPGSTPVAQGAELFWVTEDGVNWLPITSNIAPVDRAHVTTFGSRVLLVGGSTTLAARTGVLTLGPLRPPASASEPPGDFTLAVQAGNTPMIADVNKDFTLGPVTTSKDRFLLFATGPVGTAIYSSPDGGLWSQEVSASKLTATGLKGRPVIYGAIPDGQGGIIAVGKVTDSTGDNGMIWHSTASGTWTQAQFLDDTPPEFASITAGPGGFVVTSDAAGGSQIMYSTDGGDTWQAGAITVGDGFALKVATYRFGYVAVGTDPARQGATTAWTSPDGRTWTIRTDWHLPARVSALFGLGDSLVAAAATPAPGASAFPSPSAAALTSGSALPSASASPTATAKPSATPVPAPTTTTWWWSATGVVWQESGLVSSGGNFGVVGSQLLVFDAPAKTGDWTAWTSPDGKTWRRPAADPVSFAGSRSCSITSIGSRVVIVGWEGVGMLKDYLGTFASQAPSAESSPS